MFDVTQLKKAILTKSGLTEEQLERKIEEKVQTLAGLISKEGACSILANEFGVTVEQHIKTLKIKEIVPGLREVCLVGRVAQKYPPKEFQGAKGPGKVASLLLKDETGSTRIVFWNDQVQLYDQIPEECIIKLTSLQVRERNNGIELHVGERAKLTLNPEGVEIPTITTPRKYIAELKPEEQVEVLGTITQIYDLRFFSICPECSKRLIQRDGQEACAQHGAVTAQYSYVLNLLLDDGTGTLRTVLWRRQAESLFKKSSQEVLAMKDHPEQFDQAKISLLGELVKLNGRVVNNAMFNRLELHAQTVLLNPNPVEELKRFT